MTTELNDKLRKVEDQHFAEVESERLETFDQRFRDEAMEFRGSLRTVTSITQSLWSKRIEGLSIIEERNYYRAWINPTTGNTFKNFAEFLDSGEVDDISRNRYYELKKLFDAEGPAAFDVFTARRIPVSARKQLAAAGVNIAVEGDELVIGSHRVAVSDSTAIKEVVKAVHLALTERDERDAKKDKLIAEQKEAIEKGRGELTELQRAIDAIDEHTPYERALLGVVRAMITFVSNIADLDEDERRQRAEADLKTIAEQYFQARNAFGVNVPLSERSATNDDEFQSKIQAVLSESDDLDSD